MKKVMARRSSAVPRLAVAGLVLALGAAAWVLLSDDAPPLEDGSGAPLVLDSGSEPARATQLPEPVDAPPPPVPAELPPARTGGLRGRVVDRNRVPQVGASVSLHRGEPGFLGSPLVKLGPETSTDDGGLFSFADVDAEPQLVLRVQGRSFSVTDSGPHLVLAQETTDVGTIEVRPGVVISGVVLDETGHRVPGAEIAIDGGSRPDWGQPDLPPLCSTVSDEDGRFELTQAPQPPVMVTASAPGYATAGGLPEPQVAAGRFSITLRLQPASSLGGRVLASEDGSPLPGAEVRLQSSSQGNATWTRVTSDRDGRFELTGVPRGRCVVTANAPQRTDRRMVVTEASFDDELTLRLHPTRAIEGRVLGQDDVPLRAFDIRARVCSKAGAVGAPSGKVQRTRNIDGRFRLDDLEPGHYMLEVWARGWAVTLSNPIRVVRGQDTRGVSLNMQPPAALLGEVLDDLGQPVAAVRISLHANDLSTIDFLRETDASASWLLNGRTSEDGRFELTDATEGSFQLELDHPDYPLTRFNDVRVEAGERTDLGTLVLPRPAVVEGLLLDPAGQALKGTIVFLSGGHGGQISRRTLTNGEGRYRFDRLPPGAFYVEANPVTIRSPFERIAQKLERIKRDEQGRPRMSPDIILQPGDELEHLVRVDG
ncbi:MAG: hypothetical protein DRQ55_17845 [Planctomycetota bacterium]|nr:MAG: hypothetical protein DRQ55_17845 [Planctomycetota bacterium]